MPVGTLNVAVTASTRKAQEELRAFRNSVRQTGDEVKRNGVFGGGPGGDGLLKSMKQSLGQLKGALAGATAGAAVFGIGLNFGQKLGSIISSTHSWADAQKNLMAVLTGSESVEEEYFNRMARLQTILDAQGKAASERATAERKEIEAVREQTKEYERKLKVLETSERLVELEEGLRRAREINNPYMADDVRARFDAARHLADEEKRREDAKKAAEQAKHDREEKARKAEQAAERRRQVARREEQALEELKKQNRQFSMTESERRRDDISREIRDSARQRAAMRQLDELEAGEAAQRRRAFVKNRFELLRDSGGNSLAATGANTREGFAQRVRFGNQNRVDKIASDQLKTQQRMEVHLRTIATRPSIELSAANLGN